MKKLSIFSYLLLLLSTLLLNSCDKPITQFSPGIWRGAVITETGIEIPFNFEVKDSLDAYTITIINGDERIQLDDVSRDKDSIHIKFQLFDSEINGIIRDDKINGVWTKHLGDRDVEMSFYARSNSNWRIRESVVASKYNLTGKWATTFIGQDGKDTTKAVGEFVQNKSKVTGTFLTTTGDYRYLEGVLDGDQLSLSTFDGSNAFLFTAKINKDSTLSEGKFYAGFSHIENFTAKLDSSAALPDAYSLTFLKEDASTIDFNFKDLNGVNVSLKDAKFENKVVVLQLFGTWCPNCMDETAYLSKFYDRYKSKGVEIVGLAYERTKDFEKSKANLERLKQRFDIHYDLLVTGYTNARGEAAKSLPMLNKVMAFPTLIIIDKNGKVRQIHTGFNGPGTATHYLAFKAEFEKLIDGLLGESN